MDNAVVLTLILRDTIFQIVKRIIHAPTLMHLKKNEYQPRYLLKYRKDIFKYFMDLEAGIKLQNPKQELAKYSVTC